MVIGVGLPAFSFSFSWEVEDDEDGGGFHRLLKAAEKNGIQIKEEAGYVLDELPKTTVIGEFGGKASPISKSFSSSVSKEAGFVFTLFGGGGLDSSMDSFLFGMVNTGTTR